MAKSTQKQSTPTTTTKKPVAKTTLHDVPVPRANGKAKVLGEVGDGEARRSAVHARLGDTALPTGVTPTTHPHRFTADGKLKWKVAPPGVEVTARKPDEAGTWIEKWQSPKTGKWVHNYTVEEMERKAGAKFVENRRFGETLPKIRAAVARDLKGKGKDAVLALVVALIDQACFRVGNEDSAANDAHGVTTLQKRHLTIKGKTATFEFKGKHHVEQNKVVTDSTVVALLQQLDRQAKDADDRLFVVDGKPITAADVNRYLAPFDATAKAFRTFHATRLCREGLLACGKLGEAERATALKEVVEGVAERLGHTPEVCKSSYIDPSIPALFMKGRLK